MVAHEGIAQQPDILSRWSEMLEELHGAHSTTLRSLGGQEQSLALPTRIARAGGA